MCLSKSGDGVAAPHVIAKSAILGSGVLLGRFDKHIVYLHIILQYLHFMNYNYK